MKPINLFVSQPHYLDHMAPIWWALDETERGRVFTGSAQTLVHALDLGMRPVPTVWQSYPWGRRTITLDHQPHVMVAAWRDQRMSGRARTVFVEHGAGQTYLDDDLPEGQPGGPGRGRVDVFLCPSERVAALNRKAYPRAHAEPIGCPKLDGWLNDGGRRRFEGPTVALTFHWEPRRACPERGSAFRWWQASLAPTVDKLHAAGWHVLGHGHPRAWPTLQPVWETVGAEPVPSFDDVVARADVLVVDNSSVMWEWAALDRPLVFLNAPTYRRHVEHGLRFWEHADAGLQCETGSSGELADAVAATAEYDPAAAARRRAVAAVYAYTDGRSARRAAAVLRRHLP